MNMNESKKTQDGNQRPPQEQQKPRASAPQPQEKTPQQPPRSQQVPARTAEKQPRPAPSAQPPEKNLAPDTDKRWMRSKKVWTAVLLLFLLGIITGVVPAGKIPLLRNLAWAMGYSPDETQSISFLKALLTWNEHSQLMNGELDDPEETGVFGKDGGIISAHQRLEKDKDSSLFNLRAVNAFLLKQGKRADALAGAYYTVDTQEGDMSPAARITGNSAKTQANEAMPSEVFFGTESSGALPRNPKDGYNSVDSLKKIANPHISGASPTDWFGQMMDKAFLTDTDLQSIVKELNAQGGMTPLSLLDDAGRYKAQRDMYYAWLTSRTATRVSDIMLKKTLAGAGFNGAEIPRKVFDSSMSSGIGLTSDAVVGDLDNIKLRLKKEEECNNALNTSGENLVNQLEAAKSGISSLSGSFPRTCDDVNGDFPNRLAVLRNQCEQVKRAYADLKNSCGVAVKAGREGTCTTNNLQGRYDQYANYCTEEKQKCASLTDPQAQQDCLAAIKKAADYNEGDCYGGGCSETGISRLVGGTFNIGVGNNPMDPNAGDFFPETDWGATEWY